MRRSRRKKSLQQKVADRFSEQRVPRRRHTTSASRISRRHKQTNPYRNDPVAKGKFRQKLLIILGICSALATLWMLLFHSFFQIRTVQIHGLERLNEADVKEAVYGIIDYRRFLLLPGKSYVAVNVSELRDILLERFPIDGIEVTKQFPQTLDITLREKLSTIILDDGNSYQFVDLQGHQVEQLRKVGDDEWDREIQITTTTLADGTIRSEETIISELHTPLIADLEQTYGHYPVIYRKNPLADNTDVLLEPIHIQHAIQWYNLLRTTDNHMQYVTLGENAYHATIQTQTGLQYHINIENDPHEQFETLQHVLQTDVAPTATYIDVRFPNRVYWQ